MSSSKTHKWSSSSSSSLSKLFNRITRTLSFTSKKCHQASKKSNNAVKPTEPVIKTVTFVPKSAPVVRRNLPQQPPKSVQLQKKFIGAPYTPAVTQQGHAEKFILEEEEDEEDYSRYSLRPNLSLFNVSTDNIHSQSQEFDDDLPRHQDWLDDIFHSTKIDEY